MISWRASASVRQCLNRAAGVGLALSWRTLRQPSPGGRDYEPQFVAGLLSWRAISTHTEQQHGTSSNCRPQFAVGFSDNPALSLAVTECVNQVQRQLGLGTAPDFLQLLVSTDPYTKYLQLAPAFAYECFTGPGLPPPVLIGGAVDSVMSLMPRPTCSRGVSLLAASLPGVRLLPFHATTDSIPAFSPEQWQTLMRKPAAPGSTSTASGAGPGGLCGVVFCEPRFVVVESFLRRLHNLVPACTLVGGVVQQGGAPSHTQMIASVLPGHGAVFLNSECHSEGAVGCLMQGPIELRTRVVSACRPVGPVMRVTASHGNSILQLDGVPAVLALRQAMEDLDSGQPGLGGASRGDMPLEVGVDFAGRGTGFLARGLGQVNPVLGSVQVAVAEVPRGALIQLHLLDTRWGAAQFKRHLRSLLAPPAGTQPAAAVQDARGPAVTGPAGAAPTGGGVAISPGGILQSPTGEGSPPAASQALLGFSCTTISNDEPWVLAELGCNAERVLQGGKFQGELGPGPGTGEPDLYSFTSTLGLLRGA